MTARLELDSHVYEQRVENARWLASLGVHPDFIARRLGLTRGALDKMLQRSDEKCGPPA